MEERIQLLLLDTPEFAYSFFGAIKIGAVPIPTNTLWKPADFEYVLNDSRARVAIVSAALLPQLEAIPRAAAALSARGRRGRVAVAAPADYRSFDWLLGAGSPELEARAHQQGRRRLLALLLGQHRRAQGLRPPAARHGGVHASCTPAGCLT